MSGGDRTILDPDLIAAPVGVIICERGASMPADRLRINLLTPGDAATEACLVSLTHWFGPRGLYVLLTPDGARAMAAHLLEKADRADAVNATLATNMLNRSIGKGAPE